MVRSYPAADYGKETRPARNSWCRAGVFKKGFWFRVYEDSLKYYRDLKNSFDTAREEGREEGLEEGVLIVARNLLDILDDATIALKTGLSKMEVAALRMEK